jgi:hypothetical protein
VLPVNRKKEPQAVYALGVRASCLNLGFWVGRRRGVGGWEDAARPAFAAKPRATTKRVPSTARTPATSSTSNAVKSLRVVPFRPRPRSGTVIIARYMVKYVREGHPKQPRNTPRHYRRPGLHNSRVHSCGLKLRRRDSTKSALVNVFVNAKSRARCDPGFAARSRGPPNQKELG